MPGNRGERFRRWPKVAAASLTAAILAGVIAWQRLDSAPPSSSERTDVAETPQACIERMIAAAQAGDVAAYRDCFTGRLSEQVAAGEPAAASSELAASVSNLLGYATQDTEQVGVDRAHLVLERIYSGHNDHQRVDLARIGGRWKIASIERIERTVPRIPYGTPIYAAPDADDEAFEINEPGSDAPP